MVEAVVVAVVAAVVAALVAGVVAVVTAVVAALAATAAVELFEVPVEALAAMQPVRMAAVVTPARPVTRLARRAGCGRRRRGAGAVPFVRLSMMFMR